MQSLWERADGPLLTFYGDDFTGSTDVLEALALAGAPAMLFLEPPTPEELRAYPGLAAVGVAGTGRSQSPQWMDEHLTEILDRLQALGAPICHYKTCSTFDSSPEVGSIGKAADIGRGLFGRPVLCIVGVARLRRFVMFSNLFAAGSVSGASEVFRIDRHPTMSRHPTTPMHEADLRIHLGAQTQARIAGFDFTRMLQPGAFADLEKLSSEADIIVLDTFDDATTSATGSLLVDFAAPGQVFVVGSSGVEYALAQALTQRGLLPRATPPGAAAPADRLLAICGSCSPVTERQIATAEAEGFRVIAIDTAALVGGPADKIVADAVADIARAFSESSGVVVHTARGPADPRLGPTRAALKARGLADSDSARVLGEALGQIMSGSIEAAGLSRVVLAGGDSSSHAMSAMGVTALGVAATLVPGAPLCRIYAAGKPIDGVEICLKGGQVGGSRYFPQVMAGQL